MPHNDYDSPRRDEQSVTPSAEPRQPQLNTTICGCRCNCVTGTLGGEDGEGGGGADADRSYFNGDEGAGYGPIAMPMPMTNSQCSARNLATKFADYNVDENGAFSLGTANITWENPFGNAFQPEFLDRLQSPDSLAIQLHSSEEQSMVSSGFLTRHSSPGPVLNAVGSWTAASPYFFTTKPLSLAPQFLIPHEARLAPVGEEEGIHDYPEYIVSEDLMDEVRPN